MVCFISLISTCGDLGMVLSFMDKNPPMWNDTSIITINLNDPDFLFLVSTLAPALLRIGGGCEHYVVMDVNGTECQTQQTPAEYCLTMDRWKDILAFAKKTGVQMIWSLGAQRRSSGTSPLDFSNINDFLNFTASLGSRVMVSGSTTTSRVFTVHDSMYFGRRVWFVELCVAPAVCSSLYLIRDILC